MNPKTTLFCLWLMAFNLFSWPLPISAQEEPKKKMPTNIKLGPNDKPAFQPAPKGFDQLLKPVPRGKVETLQYDSDAVGSKRPVVVYTPPGYDQTKKFPVLYLLHGIGDTETGWTARGHANIIFDNLLADQKMQPMVVVMPNGRASNTIKPTDKIPVQVPAFEDFHKDLIGDLIPFIENKFSVATGRERRAIAGLSAGGAQALNIGIKNIDTFGWIAGFSPAPFTKPARDSIPNPSGLASQLKLFWISCGDRDSLLNISQDFHSALEEMNIPHVYHISPGDHTWEVWKDDLYHLSQKLFQ